jgi:hypothetical protein
MFGYGLDMIWGLVIVLFILAFFGSVGDKS